VPRTGYCASGDLLIGNIPLPQWITRDQVVADAADEIDSKLGFVYQVPIPAPPGADPTNPIPAVVPLILKRINAALASGRLILQVAAGQEDARLHAYGASLVAEAQAAIEQIFNGEIVFDNVPPANPADPVVNGPMISNLDAESNVEAFYNRIGNPRWRPPLRDTEYVPLPADYTTNQGWVAP
jgi:hypothetical protein